MSGCRRPRVAGSGSSLRTSLAPLIKNDTRPCLLCRLVPPDFQNRQRNFQNSSGEEVFPEPTSSYKLGVPKLYDAGGAHLGDRFFFFS